MLVGLIEEDGVVGLVGCELYIFRKSIYPTVSIFLGSSLTYRHLEMCVPAKVVCWVTFLELGGGDGVAPLDGC